MATMSIQCNRCGFSADMTGDKGPVELMERFDAAHDLVKPECPDTQTRSKQVALGARAVD